MGLWDTKIDEEYLVLSPDIETEIYSVLCSILTSKLHKNHNCKLKQGNLSLFTPTAQWFPCASLCFGYKLYYLFITERGFLAIEKVSREFRGLVRKIKRSEVGIQSHKIKRHSLKFIRLLLFVL